MKMLTQEELKKLSHQRLYHYFEVIRAIISRTYHYAGRRCCELCHEYIGADWQKDVADVAKPYEDQLIVVKAELKSRPYVNFSRTARKKARQEMIAGLKGNRNRLRNRSRRKANV